MATRWKTEYTGPVTDRGVDEKRRALVSREELADFQRKYGADKTLRDLLNADRTGRLPALSRTSAPTSLRSAMGMAESPSRLPSSDEVMERIKRMPSSKSPEQEADEYKQATMESLGLLGTVAAGPAVKAMLRGAGALGTVGRASETAWRNKPPPGADPAKWKEIVQKIDAAYPGGLNPPGGMSKEALAKALAEDIGSASIPRGTPMRSTATTADTGRRFTPAEEMEAATSAARGAAGRRQVQEARTGRSQAAAEAKAEKPVLRTDKAKETPRSRTRETDEDVEFKRGGKVKSYAKGGSVKGSGCEQRGLRKCKVY